MKNKNNRALIIPTYVNHFPYIYDLLKSIEVFVKDISSFDICFILSNKKEEKLLIDATKKYKKLNLKFYNIENILNSYGIDTKNILKELGKYSYQTLKKLYGVHFLKYKQAYVMDSESLFIKDTNLNELFDNYFANPFVLMCPFSAYPKLEHKNYVNFFTLKNVASMFNKEDIEYFYFDGFNWFYDINIVNDLFNYFPQGLFKAIKKASLIHSNGHPRSQAVFECILYYEFIFNNNKKYKYNFIDTMPLIENKVGKQVIQKALLDIRKPDKLYPIFMHSWEYMDIESIKKYHQIYRDLNFKMARLFITKMSDEKINTFLKESDINLIVSTDNLKECLLNIKTPDKNVKKVQKMFKKDFETLFNNSFAKDDKTYQKYQKHQMQFKEHLSHILKIPRELFSCIFYSIKWNLQKVKLRRDFENKGK